MLDAFKLYNTYSRKEEEIHPLKAGEISIYTCGPTVYNYQHIGNYRTYVFEDTLVKALRQYGYKVDRAMNLTDVGHLTSDEDDGDDKLEVGARREGITAWEVAQKYTDDFLKDCQLLNIEIPVRLIRATDAIADQIAFIEEIEKKGYTYITNDGVYFDSTKIADYGFLARLDLEGLRAGARVDVREGKRNITDFALWKFSAEPGKRAMEWESPWGLGFPGWHLECSSIIYREFGEQIDIHCGGIDHIPVHHINEIAQSWAMTGKLLANHWAHGGFLQVDGGKMSKSIGNVYLLSDFIKRGYDLRALRLFYYSASYRAALNFTWETLDSADKRLYRWLLQLAEIRAVADQEESQDLSADYQGYIQRYQHSVYYDDLNLPAVLAIIEEVLASNLKASEKIAFIKVVDEVLSLDLLKEAPALEIPEAVKALLDQREMEREVGNWAASDDLRNKILDLGYVVQDTKEGQKVVLK